jgi:hypothetical protein
MGSRLVDPAKLLMRKDSSDPDVGVIAPFDQFVPSFTGKLQVVLHNATGTRIFVLRYLDALDTATASFRALFD